MNLDERVSTVEPSEGSSRWPQIYQRSGHPPKSANHGLATEFLLFFLVMMWGYHGGGSGGSTSAKRVIGVPVQGRLYPPWSECDAPRWASSPLVALVADPRQVMLGYQQRPCAIRNQNSKTHNDWLRARIDVCSCSVVVFIRLL